MLTAATCWANSHLNTGVVAANPVAFFGYKSIEIYENYEITHCNSL